MSGETDLESAARQHAAQRIAGVLEGSEGKFRALARDFPSRVQGRGLARAAVELAAQGASDGRIKSDVHGVLLHGLFGWLQRPGGPFEGEAGAGAPAGGRTDPLHPLGAIITAAPEWAAYAQEDAQVYLRWVKRLAEIEWPEA